MCCCHLLGAERRVLWKERGEICKAKTGKGALLQQVQAQGVGNLNSHSHLQFGGGPRVSLFPTRMQSVKVNEKTHFTICILFYIFYYRKLNGSLLS